MHPLQQSTAEESPSGQYIQQPTDSANATLHTPRKKTKEAHANKLHNYFAHVATGSSLPEIEAADIPDVATDVRSTYLRLHQKRHTYAEDKNFQIVKDALSELRGYVNKKRLNKLTTNPPKTPRTIRRYFKEGGVTATPFDQSKFLAEVTYGCPASITRVRL